MTKAFFITEDDAGVLRQIISDYRRRNRSLENDGITVDNTDDQLTPEVYIIRVPYTGIPARTFLNTGLGSGGYYIPGRVECEVWKIFPVDRGIDGLLEHVLTKTHFTITVNNISWTAIYPYYDERTYNEFRVARRDKFGDWIIECNPECGDTPPDQTGTGTTGTGTTGTGTTGTGTTGTGTTGTGTTGTGTGTTGTGTEATGTGTTGTGTTGTGITGTGSTGTGTAETGTGSTGTGTVGYVCVCGNVTFPETPYVGQTADGECTSDPPGSVECIGGCTYTWNGDEWFPTTPCSTPL